MGLPDAPLTSFVLLSLGLTMLRHFVEIFCGVYAVGFVFTAVRYLRLRARPVQPPAPAEGSFPQSVSCTCAVAISRRGRWRA